MLKRNKAKADVFCDDCIQRRGIRAAKKHTFYAGDVSENIILRCLTDSGWAFIGRGDSWVAFCPEHLPAIGKVRSEMMNND